MSRVLIISEDRTGGGLNQVIMAAVDEARQHRKAARLTFLPPGTVDGRDRLLRKCSEYLLLRYKRLPRADHVLYVMDARGAEDSPLVLRATSQPLSGKPWGECRDELCQLCREAMTRMAREGATEWDRDKEGFHPHTLVWERESLLLPVLAELGLGESEPRSIDIRRATEVVRNRLPSYSKRVHGARYLKQIASQPELTHKVLTANESLRSIVESLVAL